MSLEVLTWDIPFYKNSIRVTSSAKGLQAVTFRPGKPRLPQPRQSWVQAQLKQFELYFGSRGHLGHLPIDWSSLKGTDFQKSVWKRLAKVPWGQSISYGELAEEVGRPGAARAVGSACGRNPVLLVIPCHRVMSRDSLGGFSGGGLSVKRRLLELEGIPYKG